MDNYVVAAVIAAASTLAAAVIAGLFARSKKENRAPPSPKTISAGAGHAVTASGDVHIGDRIQTVGHAPPKLEITNVGFTHEAELDVHIRNVGDDALIINAISILMVKDYHRAVKPVLEPTATYKIAVDGMREGETRCLDVSHYVDPHKADRLLIALDTTHYYRLRVTLHYDRGEAVSFEKGTWGWDESQRR